MTFRTDVRKRLDKLEWTMDDFSKLQDIVKQQHREIWALKRLLEQQGYIYIETGTGGIKKSGWVKPSKETSAQLAG